MKKTSETVVFFGSGPVAAKCLELLNKDFLVEAVITKPKPEHHRGDFPVLTIAEKLKLKVFAPSSKKELSELFTKNPVMSRLGIVIDYGIIIAADVIDQFPLGIVNSHFSLLPRWRGADPISFAILEGDAKTGVSLMVIDEGMDTGKLITRRVWHIKPKTTTPELTEQLIVLSHELLTKYLPLYIEGGIKPHAQPHPARATYSRKLTKEDGVIDWHKSAQEIEREIRAFIEWPKSQTVLGDIPVTITAAHVVPVSSGKPGEIEVINKTILAIHCGTGYLCIDTLKPSGKKQMPADAFLAGYSKRLI